MNLVHGGFRTIDGFIGGDDNDEYRVDTQFASIGVRGTTHEAVIDALQDALFTGVYDGSTTVSNNDGSIQLGLGADYDFSRTDRGRAPEGLPSIPEQLGNLNLNAGVASAEEDDSESDDSAENGDEEQEVADSNDGESQENKADVAEDNENTGENEADVALNTSTLASQTPDNNLANNPAVNNNDSQIIAALTRLSESADENPNLTDNLVNNPALASLYPLYQTSRQVNPDNDEGTDDVDLTDGNATFVATNVTSESRNTVSNSPQGSNATNIETQINPANNIKDLQNLEKNTVVEEEVEVEKINSGVFSLVESENNDEEPEVEEPEVEEPEVEEPEVEEPADDDSDDDRGHGNDADGVDEDNPGNSNNGSDDATPGNSGNSSGNNNSDDDSSPGNSGNSSGNGNNDSDADSGSGNSDNSNGNGNNEPEGDDADPGPGNSGSSSGNGNNDSDADSGPGNSGSSNGNGNNDSEDNNLISGNPDLTVDECLASPFCVLEEDTSKGKGNNTDNGNGNGNNSSKLTQSGENLIRNLITSSSALINDSIDRVVSGSVDDNTVLITSISTDAEGGIDSSASVGDLTINWGYWSLPGLLSQDQEFSRQEFQRVYLAVVDPADMDALKSTSANWSYNSVADQFTGSGSAGTMTDLNVGFDVDLNSGAIRNGSFSAEVDYGEELWSMNFTGNVNGAVASMNNFSDSVVITPAGISQGIQGELGGVFTGTGNTNAFVTGFSLNNGSNAVLGGFGLLEGSAP